MKAAPAAGCFPALSLATWADPLAPSEAQASGSHMAQLAELGGCVCIALQVVALDGHAAGKGAVAQGLQGTHVLNDKHCAMQLGGRCMCVQPGESSRLGGYGDHS